VKQEKTRRKTKTRSKKTGEK